MTRSPSLAANPLISSWLTFNENGTVILRVGKWNSARAFTRRSRRSRSRN